MRASGVTWSWWPRGQAFSVRSGRERVGSSRDHFSSDLIFDFRFIFITMGGFCEIGTCLVDFRHGFNIFRMCLMHLICVWPLPSCVHLRVLVQRGCNILTELGWKVIVYHLCKRYETVADETKKVI